MKILSFEQIELKNSLIKHKLHIARPLSMYILRKCNMFPNVHDNMICNMNEMMQHSKVQSNLDIRDFGQGKTTI